MIKAVFIDVDNTLLDFNECAKESITRALELRGMAPTENLFPTFFRINTELWHRIEKGSLTRDELFKIRFNLIFGELGIKLDGVEFEKDFRIFLSESAVTVENAQQVLKYLSAKYPLYVASNAVHKQQVNRLKKAGLYEYIKEIFTSEIIGYSKPSKEFFDGVFERLGNIKRQDVILIGDSLEADIKGGIDNGLKVCWFNYAKETLPEDIKPDYAIDSLSELAEIL